MTSRDQFLDADCSEAKTGGKRGAIRFRSIRLSDVHMGTTGCRAGRLLEFLRATISDTVFLVDDIIDGWQLKRRRYWDQDHNDVVQTVLN